MTDRPSAEINRLGAGSPCYSSGTPCSDGKELVTYILSLEAALEEKERRIAYIAMERDGFARQSGESAMRISEINKELAQAKADHQRVMGALTMERRA